MPQESYQQSVNHLPTENDASERPTILLEWEEEKETPFRTPESLYSLCETSGLLDAYGDNMMVKHLGISAGVDEFDVNEITH